MIYRFRCECGEETELQGSIHDHEIFTIKVFCQCGGRVQQVIEPSRTIFHRTGFPRNAVHEHIADKPVKLRDKKHFQDIANQNGWTTSWFDGV